MEEVWQNLREAADEDGLLSFRDYMDLALYGPGGYYQRLVRLGGAGSDFYTAAQFPLFGLTLGRYIYEQWQQREKQGMLRIVELGPGQGELAFWICTYLVSVLGKHSSAKPIPLEYRFVERSDYLRQVQQERVAPFLERIAFQWTAPSDIQSGIQLPRGDVAAYVFVIANELLDALPVERVRRGSQGFERGFVRIVQQKGVEEPLAEVFLPAGGDLSRIAQKYTPVPLGHIAEVCLDYENVFAACAALAREVDGVFFDYGTFADEWRQGIRPQGTLRAFYKHTLVDALARPGEADITTDVNWDLARDAANSAGLLIRDIRKQGSFLMQNGIMDVAMELTNGDSPLSDVIKVQAGLLSTTAALKQLVLPGGMGERFLAFVFTKRGGSGEQGC